MKRDPKNHGQSVSVTKDIDSRRDKIQPRESEFAKDNDGSMRDLLTGRGRVRLQ